MADFVTIDLQSRLLPNYKKASREELAKKVRELANIANNRLRALEKYSKKVSKKTGVQIDLTDYGAYKYAERMTKNRPSVRFRSGSVGYTMKELRAEYEHIVTFLGLKTSMIQGATKSIMKQYQDFIALSSSEETPFDEYIIGSEGGSEGGLVRVEPISFSDYWHLLERAWDSLLKEIYGSEVVAVALAMGQLDVLEEIQREVKRENEKQKKPSYITNGEDATPTDDFKGDANLKLRNHPIGKKILNAAAHFKSKR